MPQEIQGDYEFGDFRFDAAKRVLWRQGAIVALTPKAAEVLSLLISNRGNLVERQELLDTVWNDTFVEEGNLNHAVSALRRVLGSDAIQTVPRRGYRFTEHVNEVVHQHASEVILERRTLSRSIVAEEVDDHVDVAALPLATSKRNTFVRFGLPLVGLVLIFAAVWFAFGPRTRTADPNGFRSVAVIPFTSANPEPDPAFSNGLTESLVTRLGSLGSIAVRSTNSAAALYSEGIDPLEIARKLEADTVMTGSYQKSDGRIRLNVRLLRTSDGIQVWAGQFDEHEQDIFRLQDSLAAQAAKYLIDRLTSEQQTQLARRPTEDIEAYKLYMRARYEWSKRTAEGFNRSIADYRSAIDRDPNFSLAYAGLADSYVLLADYNLELPSVAFPKAKAAALRALETDPTNSVRPHTTLAYVLATYDWDYAGAEREYRAAIQVEPKYATAHQWYGELLYALHRYSEADAELATAADLDPLAPTPLSERAVLLYYQGKLDEALTQFSALKVEHPSFPTSYIFSAWIYDLKGMPNEAFANEIEFYRLQDVGEERLREMTSAFERGGRDEFLGLIAGGLEKSLPIYKIPHTFARLRNREKTLDWIEKCIEARSPNIIKVYSDHNFDFVRDDPRFEAALAQLRLPL